MAKLGKLENGLNNSLGKKAPYQLPEKTRKALVQYMPVIALVVGILQLLAAWGLWRLGHVAERWVDYTRRIDDVYGMHYTAQHLGPFYYLALFVLVVGGLMLVIAYNGLKNHQKSGWNLLFYSLLLNTAYGVLRLFTDEGNGFAAFFGALIGSLVGAYVLFQIRSYYLTGAARKPLTTKSK